MLAIIPSKSYAHRAYICDFLAGGDGSSVICDLDSDDIKATRRCLETLRDMIGAGEEQCTEVGRGTVPELDCGESGSTLRFILPLIGVLRKPVTIKTHGRLSERPMGPFEDELIAHGMTIRHLSGSATDAGEQGVSADDAIDRSADTGVITASGKLTSGVYRLPGSISSQYITGLLLALPYLEGDSRIDLTSELQSSAYVDITIDVLKEYGVGIDTIMDKGSGMISYVIRGGQKYHRETPYKVEGDWSQAAFWLAAGVIGKMPVSVTGLNPESVQGDREIVDVLRSFGARIDIDDAVTAYPSDLKGTVIDVSEIPDLAPAIACAGAAATGETRLVNAGRLRLKESDRIRSIVECLSDVGVFAEEGEEEIIIHGCGEALPAGGTAETAGDHRIVMMAAVLSLITRGKVTITGSSAVSKSYPTFFEEFKKAGLSGNILLT